MKIKLIHEIFELNFPLLDLLGILAIKLLGFVIGANKLDASRCSKYFFFRLILGTDDLEYRIKGNHEALLAGFVINGMMQDSFGSEDQHYWGSVVWLKIKCRC